MVGAFGGPARAASRSSPSASTCGPSERHLPVVRYWHPDEFAALEAAALRARASSTSPPARSCAPSYHADETCRAGPPGVGPLAAPASRAACSRSGTTSRPSACRRHGRADRRERDRLPVPPGRRLGLPQAGLGGDWPVPTVRGDPVRGHRPRLACCHRRRAAPTRRDRCSRRCSCTAACCTSAATCCSCGSSATTSRTRWARCKFLVFYLLGGLAADAAQILIEPGVGPCRRIGASGAVAAVLGGYLLLFRAPA